MIPGQATKRGDHMQTATTPDATLQPLTRLIGSWTTEATHRAMPGVVVHGTADISWLEGKRFLIVRSHTDHPDFPDSISIIGVMDRDRAEDPRNTGLKSAEPSLRMHYFDSRGVFRVLDATIDDKVWTLSRSAPGFSQRFTGTIASDGRTIDGLWTLCEDDMNWKDDLQMIYRRQP
jgi:hypothetical protein